MADSGWVWISYSDAVYGAWYRRQQRQPAQTNRSRQQVLNLCGRLSEVEGGGSLGFRLNRSGDGFGGGGGRGYGGGGGGGSYYNCGESQGGPTEESV